ncbi:PAS domain-containing protein [Stakelama marina]|uniref:PAS domain-containing protein n=1 Tax=Stakelama marina TaxID=2826939 RepID=A0A8T4IDY4_9SPHN|nr:PAS domain-containing protein [Stakelama marina]MBR0553228.1 PAS domain-containing protein [Stakelama marina]
MQPTEPLPLNHSWPLIDQAARLAPDNGVGIGRWACDLADNALDWSDQVYDIFGLPRGERISRADAVALYCEDSRDAMERLRAHAIRHRRGFTVDVRIRPVGSPLRWMRLSAAPICRHGQVVALHGLKQDVTREYR